ncbi:cytochrome b/b6 domain-containing protein [Roseovarius sp. SCSIO 43702]|uniref:cytochrome b/b6 domain-containing protein n=1 Tax=Roseovarius sp. SCSIO 43702 TaxID=2823043 RepID=UPI001C737A3E|nr:cytochrome b/b6 domain-containing protein [Roseovarius sp. SCSIO 43702]QYX56035.1 cytochrome b/b6 domain-containing protein [Roseovarius sp. SCSIO 43702]
MPLGNSHTTYGSVTKTFHWLTALLILTNLGLGIWATNIAQAIEAPDVETTDATVARATFLFSLHKTIGVTVFFVALARIAWAIVQPKPGLLNGDDPLEARLAETAHWLLYGSIVLVPLTGWVHHAAATGFAPIWWPFGQTLPFVPKSEYVSEFASTLHYILQWVLIGTIVAHVAGAFKHHLIDGDATLRRMLPGHGGAEPTARQPGHVLPVIAALAIWAAALGGGVWLGWFPERHAGAATAASSSAESDWQVQSGTLAIEVMQMGSAVEGRFSDWSADITYDETPDAEGRHGDVTVTIATPSLTLGSVTEQAMGSTYLAAETHPTARYEADLVDRDGTLMALGTLTIKEQEQPLDFPVQLEIDGDTARASGTAVVDRRSFDIGGSVNDPSSLGFDVTIRFELTATRATE